MFTNARVCVIIIVYKSFRSKVMNPIYKKYKERFIQISGRNKSLYLKGIVKKYSYDIGFIMENRTDTDDFLDFLWHRRRTFSLINDKVIAKMVKQSHVSIIVKTQTYCLTLITAKKRFKRPKVN